MTGTTTLTLADFLLARIAEDERSAHYARTRDDVSQRDWGGWWIGHYHHYRRHDPARVLAECEAKRRIVELLSPPDPHSPGECSDCDVLYLLALPHADHPEFREEWKL